jgi:hypothetical protein
MSNAPIGTHFPERPFILALEAHASSVGIWVPPAARSRNAMLGHAVSDESELPKCDIVMHEEGKVRPIELRGCVRVFGYAAVESLPFRLLGRKTPSRKKANEASGVAWTTVGDWLSRIGSFLWRRAARILP